MDYRRFGDNLVVRIDRGEEVVGTLMALCEKENIGMADPAVREGL